MAANPNWWNPAWLYRLTIIVDHTKIAEDMTEMLLSLTHPHLSNALANGDDILLCKANNDDQLNHEIEYFDQSSGILVLWVKHDISASVDTTLYLYYGNAASGNQQDMNGTWKDNYKLIQHLQETSGNRIDSTINANDSISTTGSAAPGKIDGAMVFLGGTSNINFGHGTSLDITDAITLSVWVQNFYIPIYDIDDLQAMNNDLTKSYLLMNNIDASITSTWNGGLGFVPIGSSGGYFTGNFEGNNKTITGLVINRPLENYIGLFGATSSASLKNFELIDAVITGNDDVAGIAGFLQSTTVTNIKVTNITLVGDMNVGGFFGRSRSSCYNCSTSGSVTGSNQVGGFGGTRIGGYKFSFKTYDCYSTCTVNGNSYVGGLIGYAQGHTRSATKLYRSYATGLVIGITNVGGLAGASSAATSYNSFWDTQTTNQATSALGTPATTAEMKQQATFTADPTYPWDFVDVWDITENVTYPWLRPLTVAGDDVILLSKGRDAYSLEMDFVGTTLKGFINNTEINVAVIPNAEMLVELKYDGVNLRLLVNGVQVNSIPLVGTINTNVTDLTAGDGLIGMLDELRISNITKSDDFSLATYDNQDLLADFFTYQQEDALYFDLKIINHLAVPIEGARIIIRDNVATIVTVEDTLVTGSITQQAYINSKTAHAIQAYKYGKDMMPSVLDIDRDLDWTFTLYVDPYISETDEAIVLIYTGITIDHVTETITIAGNHTIEEIYDYCQHNIITNTQSDINQIIKTGNGVNFTCEYDFVINDGITVTATNKKVTMVVGKTYNLNTTGQFIGIIADSTKTRIPVTLNGVIDGSRYRIEKSSDGTKIFDGTQSGSGSIINYYEHTVDTNITIKVRKSSGGTKYLPLVTTGELINIAFALSITQIKDNIVT